MLCFASCSFNLFPLAKRPNLGALAVFAGHVQVGHIGRVQQLLKGNRELEPPVLLDLCWMVAAKHLPVLVCLPRRPVLPYREPNSLNFCSGLAKVVPHINRLPGWRFPWGNRSKLRRKDGLWIGSIRFHLTPKCSISVDSTPEFRLRQVKKRWKALENQALCRKAD